MFPPNTYFSIAPQVVSEQYDSEAIVINLDSGTYYSLNADSSRLWALIGQHESAQAIVQAFNPNPISASDEVAKSVHDFLTRLSQEKLIVTEKSSDLFFGGETLTEISGSDTLGTVPSFGMQIFTDMQDLLLMDPIHDVEAEGWPVARQASGQDKP